MSEFKIHHLLGELLTLLGSKGSPQDFIEILQKKTESNPGSLSHVMLQSKIQSLAKHAKNPILFLDKFQELKLKNVDSFGSFIQLLSYISEDSSLKHFLTKSDKLVKNVKKSKTATEMTSDDLPQVKHRLLKAIKKPASSILPSSETTSTSTSVGAYSVPSVLSWVQQRPYISWDFALTRYEPVGNIDKVPTTSQMNILIQDLLNILIGLDGSYIEAKPLLDPYGPREFKINDNVDVSLSELAKQILPLASYYSMMQRFVEEKMQFEYGQVNNALCAAIQTLLIDYSLFICQLESEFKKGSLCLQKLWFYVQSNMYSMGIVADITATISKADARGGKVLSLLHEQTLGFIGDANAQELCLSLIQAASVPYMNILEMWIYKGVIRDPMKEFLVEDNEVINREELPLDYSADYWAKRYTVRRERIPKFLERVSDIILRAGKYLNVIRQCGKTITSKTEHLVYSIDERDYVETIEKAYLFASKTLLDLLLNENDLMGRLRSVKHYFLLDQGDFIVQFLNLSEKELVKDVNEVSISKLESLLEISLRVSSANSDCYKDDMRTVLLPYDLQFQMCKILSILTNEENDYWKENGRSQLTGLESFSFSYEVRWPISLILNHKALACYQMIFRHLFYCKYIERFLCRIWRSTKVAKIFTFSSSCQYRTAYALRQHMLHCVQNLEYHMMVEVIEPNWNTFLQRIAKVNNVDEVLVCHCDFQDMCLKDCMLTSPTLLKTITHLLGVCQDYCVFMLMTQQHSVDAELGSLDDSNNQDCFDSIPLIQTNLDDSMVIKNEDTFGQNIERLHTRFSVILVELLDKINQLGRDSSNDRLFNLLYRLDYAYYTSTIEKITQNKSTFSG